ncbi:MAG: branched-chain amino acid ABC transporter permease [Deltaproteobacteria bacterium]|nr:branched-chain amino acid ABC transporter permease [Deltaproteobacteria bacterium]MBW2046190.1 branched-chain amino acid ABC transporter permease [Deltaproteobacteria bacterium]MBW2299013.1 branched-chain amino acid ABC transporter permease [Deltaproteobacteria bacterium]
MDLVESYKDEMRLIDKPWKGFWIGLLLMALLLLPWLGDEYMIYMVSLVCIYSIGVQGQNILIGYTGQISLGQAGFLAIGAFTLGHLSRLGVPVLLGLLGAGLAAGLFGLVVGFPCLRLKGPYLAIATLGFGIAVYEVFVNSQTLSGGRMGLIVPKFSPLFGLSGSAFYYYFSLLIGVVFTLVSFNIISSYIGRAFIAIRDNDIAAEAIGVNLTFYKLLSFVVSSFYTGVQGGLYGLLMGYVEPNMFTFLESVTLFIAVIIGGLASVEGSIMGAAFVILVPHIFSSYKELVPVAFGISILLVLIFEPLGLYGRWLKIRLYFRNWPFR